MTAPILFQPPAEVRELCCAGLMGRRSAGRGGTARSVPFATRVCAGGPVTAEDLAEMLAHMAAIEQAMSERGLADPALTIAWNLWGGDPGREWAESFVHRTVPAAPQPAEPVLAAPTAAGWVDRLNGLAVGERELLARIHELMEAGVEIAISRLRAKVANTLQRPSTALKAAFSGLHVRDALLASMREADGALAAVHLVPAPIMAKVAPNIEADETVRGAFTQLAGRIRLLVLEHQRDVLDVLQAAGLPDGQVAAAADEMAGNLDGAVRLAIDELMVLVAQLTRSSAGAEEGEIPAGRVPASLAFRLLSGAGGGDPGDGSRQDWALVGSGEVLCAGVALGVTALRAAAAGLTQGVLQAAVMTVDRAPELSVATVTRWRWGGSARPFPSHQRLNGVEWSTEDQRQEVCRNVDVFPPVATLHPGDHAGCSCSYEVQLRIGQAAPGRATIQVPQQPQGEVPDPSQPTAGVRVRVDRDAKVTAELQRQVGNMARQLHGIDRAADDYDIVLTSTKVEGDAFGMANRGRGQVWINTKVNTNRPSKFRTDDFFVANGQKVTEAEYTMIHEWAHTVDRDPRRIDALQEKMMIEHREAELAHRFDGAPKPESPWPSVYAGSNGAELFAESWADWHIDPKSAHPVTKRLAKEFGWKAPERPLAEVSVLREKGA